MKDIEGVHIRMRENSVLTTLRRFIPGEFQALREISNPIFDELEIDFEMARVYTQPLKSPVLSLLMAETLSERQEPVAGFLRSKGEWTFIPDGASGGASGLWMFCVMDFPERFLQKIRPHVKGCGTVCVRPLKESWLVGAQAILLKSIIKNANRRDY